MDEEEECIKENSIDDVITEDICGIEHKLLPAASNMPNLTVEQKQKHLLSIRRQFFILISQHMQNFQRAMIASRRHCQQRYRRRQSLLRTFYLQKLLEIQTNFIEYLPLLHASSMTNGSNNNGIVTPINKQIHINKLTTKPNFDFYDNVQKFSQQQWLETFRMSKQTFDWLCAQLKNLIQPIQNRNRIITLEKSVAVALYALASGDEYGAIAQKFNLCNSTVYKIRTLFVEAFLKKLSSYLITMPKKTVEFQEIRTAFKQASNMPALVVGVIGACELPPINKNDNNKRSITFEALVDDRLLFRKVKLHSKVPSLFVETPNDILNVGLQLVNGKYIPCFAVCATPYYPLRLWLMQEYEKPTEPHEYDFNEAIENLIIFKNEAFQRLFSRWKILQRNFNMEPNTMTLVATACVALHNLVEENEEEFLEEWTKDAYVSYEVRSTNILPNAIEALTMRNFLARTISSTEI